MFTRRITSLVIFAAAISVIAAGIILLTEANGENSKNVTNLNAETEFSMDKSTDILVATQTDGKNRIESHPAEHKNEITPWNFDTAYKLCTSAISDYYHASIEGTEINLDTYIANPNLKNYTQQKIESELTLRSKLNCGRFKIVDITFGVMKVDWLIQKNSYYVKVDARIKADYGGETAEPTEFLVQNLNGKLVIADWYTSGSLSCYDNNVRGEFQQINDPGVWNNNEWVKKISLNVKNSIYNKIENTKAPQEVIETFFKACNEKNIDLLLTTVTTGEGKKYTQAGVFDNQKSIELLNIDEFKATINKRVYMGQHPELVDARIFWVEYKVVYNDVDKSVSGKNGEDGQNFILVKATKESPWLINGRGL